MWRKYDPKQMRREEWITTTNIISYLKRQFRGRGVGYKYLSPSSPMKESIFPRDCVGSAPTTLFNLPTSFSVYFFHYLTIKYFITLVAYNRSIVSALLQDFLHFCGLFTIRTTIRVRSYFSTIQCSRAFLYR